MSFLIYQNKKERKSKSNHLIKDNWVIRVSMIENIEKIGLVCCSNGQRKECYSEFEYLEKVLLAIGLKPVFSDCIYSKESVFSGTAKERADSLMKFYRDDEIKGIFDISGGNIANGILPYLDYNVIANSSKLFWGYSDLTTVINAIYTKTGKASVLYQIRNLIYDYREQQIKDFVNTVIDNGDDLFKLDYEFIQGNEMQGIVVGGNIRCFLKLAGTEYMPDLKDKILLLESYSGGAGQIETYLCQLQQMGAFDKVSGVLLGTFTEMEESNCVPTVEELVLRIVGGDVPVAATKNIGHGDDSKAMVIGQELKLRK